MKLKSFGCSFIFGSDLPDIGNSYYAYGSNFTWPALLAKQLNYDYRCYAKPSSGNLQILERLLNEATNDQSVIYVVQWSWIDRFDYIDERPENYWPGTKWESIVPASNDNLAKTYYKHLHSQYQDKLLSLIYIKTAIDTMIEKQIPFIMTYIDDLIFETEWHSSPAIQELQEYIRPHMITFEDQTFLEWSRKKGFPISETHHPLEQAHSEAVKVLYKQNTIDRLRLA